MIISNSIIDKLQWGLNMNEQNFRILDIVKERFEDIYGNNAPKAFLKRLEMEKSKYLLGYEALIFDEILGKIKSSLRNMRYHSHYSITYGSTLISYLLGVTDNNPLPLHYYCPACKKVEMIDSTLTMWDIEAKKCECGGKLNARGFNIPYEIHSTLIDAPGCTLFVGFEGLDAAYNTIRETLKDYNYIEEADSYTNDKIFTILPKNAVVSTGSEPMYKRYSYITVTPKAFLDELRTLESKHEIKYEDIDFSKINLDLVNFDFGLLEDTEIANIKPQSKLELLKICGLLHGTNVWADNGENLLQKGIITLSELPAFRDDIFEIIKPEVERIGANLRYAEKITRQIRMGRFTLNMVSPDVDEVYSQLKLPKWFEEFICSIRYMFAKAHGIELCKINMAISYYKSIKNN